MFNKSYSLSLSLTMIDSNDKGNETFNIKNNGYGSVLCLSTK